MPILANAKKALRSSKRKTEVNQVLKSKTRTLIKKARLNPVTENLSAAYSAIDKSVKKNLMHKNKAARLKSALALLQKNTDSKKSADAKTTKKSDTKKASNPKTKKTSSKTTKKTSTKKASAKKSSSK
jgi:small subunit ribosomal protein S20